MTRQDAAPVAPGCHDCPSWQRRGMSFIGKCPVWSADGWMTEQSYCCPAHPARIATASPTAAAPRGNQTPPHPGNPR